MYSRIFICLNFNLHSSVLTIYAFVFKYKRNALLLMKSNEVPYADVIESHSVDTSHL